MNFIQVSWEKALGVFDARLANIPRERGTKLRFWKQIVEKHHLDFVARLPAGETPTLAVLVQHEDGRTEGSQYPNLIPSGEREQYGL